MNKNLVTVNNPTSVAAELFKTLRTNVEFGIKENQNIIMITSGEPSDGKSFVSSNLSASFALMGKKVLLIDLDLRKGQQHKIFNVKNSKGMSNLLNSDIDNEDKMYEELLATIQLTLVDNLFIITSGSILNNPSELLMNGKLLCFLEYFKDKFDYIFIDVPPLTIVTDPAIIARYVDASILVTSMDKTNSKILKEANNILDKTGTEIIGVVVNNVKLNKGSYKYKKYEYTDESNKVNKDRKNNKKVSKV